MEQNIVVVDDEIEITDLIELYLISSGYKVKKFYSGAGVLDYIERNQVDLAILDIMLPGIDGYTLCEKIRQHQNFPIIMLTAKGEVLDKIKGLAIGADAYLTKPFRPLEMVANVKAQLRRFTYYNHGEEMDSSILTISGLILNKVTHECYLNEKLINFTPIEFSLLSYLCERKGQAVKADELFQAIWKEKYYTNSTNTLMVHIRHIREKMNEAGASKKYIKNVWGVGYKIEE